MSLTYNTPFLLSPNDRDRWQLRQLGSGVVSVIQASTACIAVYIVSGLPKNAESRGCNNESCGPSAGAVERGGSL